MNMYHSFKKETKYLRASAGACGRGLWPRPKFRDLLRDAGRFDFDRAPRPHAVWN